MEKALLRRKAILSLLSQSNRGLLTCPKILPSRLAVPSRRDEEAFYHSRLLSMRFFSKNNKPEQESSAEEAKNPQHQEKKVERTEEPKKKEAANEDSSSSSSDEEGSTLSREDVKQIKKLIQEQEQEIDKLKEQTKALKEKLVY